MTLNRYMAQEDMRASYISEEERIFVASDKLTEQQCDEAFCYHAETGGHMVFYTNGEIGYM